MAVAAARMALADAGLADGGEAWQALAEDAALVLATAYGPSSVTEELEEQILLTGPEAASPALFAESVANAPAAQVARLTGARGANLTVTAREAGGLLAVRQAAAEIAAGRSPLVLAGIVDEITDVLQAVLDRNGALARSREPGRAPVARPFDRRRGGFVTGEGAAVLVLEHPERALRDGPRGRRPLATVAAAGSAFDPTAPRAGWGTGHAALGAALRRTLERAGLGPSGIDLVVSGASGSRAGDRLEALTLREAWGGSELPPVVAPKGVTGELGGGLLAAGVLAMEGAVFGPSQGFRRPDPELGLTPWPGGPFPRPVRRVLLTTLAVGGGAVWVVLEGA
jgi:3-oxoacyl-[acyl-carrier-protein] synthase II